MLLCPPLWRPRMQTGCRYTPPQPQVLGPWRNSNPPVPTRLSHTERKGSGCDTPRGLVNINRGGRHNMQHAASNNLGMESFSCHWLLVSMPACPSTMDDTDYVLRAVYVVVCRSCSSTSFGIQPKAWHVNMLQGILSTGCLNCTLQCQASCKQPHTHAYQYSVAAHQLLGFTSCHGLAASWCHQRCVACCSINPSSVRECRRGPIQHPATTAGARPAAQTLTPQYPPAHPYRA